MADWIKRFVLMVVCLLAAIGCYTFGIPKGGIAFLLLGLVFEGLFWFGLLGNRKHKKTG
ncbi:hypothetical protein [Bacterioplanoides sp. SCSIO 12839]|uniref:hypothetical protein n=1 Tax=Bacterioplanoides sp. SCSIO 12839 TaxID=2829569 RepID=UPI002106296C|nr:hypothetical protein [Bacterioplanoides sp. SCSIO 12839]UTW49615.1 hypothetical protein KFF03_06935 [Bacterioplanoides sp. SCSIO 12839]